MKRLKALMNASAVELSTNSKWTALVFAQINRQIYIFMEIFAASLASNLPA